MGVNLIGNIYKAQARERERGRGEGIGRLEAGNVTQRKWRLLLIRCDQRPLMGNGQEERKGVS